MGRPMPSILTRHILAELLRVMTLTTSVLVAVIAFGAAIRPIMQNLLVAEDLLQFVALASVPMLQFALPFAGAFAGTIVYARLAAENEVVAMSAAGLSYRRVLLPAAALGLGLFVGMLLLVDLGVPRFWTSMRRLVTRDVTRLFVSSVERGEALVVPGSGTQLDADEVRVIAGDALGEGTDAPVSRLLLAGVAALEIGPDGRPQTEFTAEFATIDVYRANDSAYLKPVFRNATAYRAGEDALVYVPQAEPEAIDLGKGVRIDPKDLGLRGLLALWSDAEGYYKVADERREVLLSLGALDRWAAIGAALASDGVVAFTDAGGRRGYEVRNARLGAPAGGGVELLPRTGATLELVEIERGVATRRAGVPTATLVPEPRTRGEALHFELLARPESVTTLESDLPGAAGAGRWPPRIVGLEPRPAGDVDRSALDGATLAAETAAPPPPAAGPLGRAAHKAAGDAALRMLEAERLVRADIVARVVQRFNQSLAAPLMILLGATLAVRMRGANPLNVYLLAFLPSIGDILLISGGEQMLKEATSLQGVLVCSSGNLGIVVAILLAYRRIARN
jgi:lipopolysaccharide export system permease protein